MTAFADGRYAPRLRAAISRCQCWLSRIDSVSASFCRTYFAAPSTIGAAPRTDLFIFRNFRATTTLAISPYAADTYLGAADDYQIADAEAHSSKRATLSRIARPRQHARCFFRHAELSA